MKKIGIYSAILPFFILIMIGCREEIIPPDNPATNVNEIFQQRTGNSYTFSINAKDISFNMIDYPNLNSNRTRASFFISDYSAGAADVIINSSGQVIFRDKLKSNLNGSYVDISGYIPSTIQIKCENFTGKLRIQLSRL